MLGFGHGPELIIILVIALIVLGPGKIPEIAQTMGKAVRELRKASAELQQTFDVNQLMNPPAPAPPAAPTPEPAPVEAAVSPVPTYTEPVTLAPEPAAVVAEPVVTEPVKPKRTRKKAAPLPSLSHSDGRGTVDVPPDSVTIVKPRARKRPAADGTSVAAVGEASVDSAIMSSGSDGAEPGTSEPARPRRRSPRKAAQTI